MQNADQNLSLEKDYYDDYNEICQYIGTDFLEVKIYLICVFALIIAIFSLIFNTFFVIVFVLNASLRRSALYYFGILAVLDTFLAVNYMLLMIVPVIMDKFQILPLYYMFLTYLRPMMMLSNWAMFSSVLLIIMATVERLLRTFQALRFEPMKHTIENRPLMCLICLTIAFIYKLPTYFEMYYEEKPNCSDWARYEISATALAFNETYRFWFMFVTRTLVDRIIPFFLLVLLNFMIIRTLRKETERFAALDKKTTNCNERSNKRTLRDATRTLVAVVTLYLASQSLQVFITFWEAFHRHSLENDYMELYSYLNDIVSILSLLCSAIRFPVYMSCNRPIFTASMDTLHRFSNLFCGARRKKQLKAMHSLQKGYASVPTDTVVLSISKNGALNSSKDLYMIRASLDESEEQWMV